MFNVYKSCFSEILSSEYSGVCVRFVEGECLEDDLCEAFKGPIVGNAIVVCVDLAVYVLEFYPGTGFHVPGIISEMLGVEWVDLRINLLEEDYGRFEDWDHVTEMNKVKVIAVEPFVFDVVHIKPVQLDLRICVYLSMTYLTFGGTHVGCIGLRSSPNTSALGYFSPTNGISIISLAQSFHILSIAHIPVPVPKSAILCGFSPIGA